MATTSFTFRDAIRQLSPPWLRGKWGERLLYPFGLHLDGLGDSGTAGLKMRFPGLYSPESLSLIGRDRGITRGQGESDASYAARLAIWWDTQKRKGSPIALLKQLHAWFSFHPIQIEFVLNAPTTARDGWMLNVDGSIVRTSRVWNWDGNTDPTRFWLIFHTGVWPSEGVWSDPGIWGDGGTIGTTASPGEVSAIRSLVCEWRAPHARCENIIIVTDEVGWAASQPDGTWARWSHRNRNAAYWDGA